MLSSRRPFPLNCGSVEKQWQGEWSQGWWCEHGPAPESCDKRRRDHWVFVCFLAGWQQCPGHMGVSVLPRRRHVLPTWTWGRLKSFSFHEPSPSWWHLSLLYPPPSLRHRQDALQGEWGSTKTTSSRAVFHPPPHFIFPSQPHFSPVCFSLQGGKGQKVSLNPQTPRSFWTLSPTSENLFIIPKINIKAAKVNIREAKL